jgi:biotin carboxyl carrier protein
VTFEVEVNGVLTSVTVESSGAIGADGGRFHIVTRRPGEPGSSPVSHHLHATRTDLGFSLLFDADHRGLDVAATPRAAGEYLVQLPNVPIVAVVDCRRFERASSGEAAGHGEQRVTAPMPGRVVRVLVKTGEMVAARQGLVVVEAMKMENELTVPRAGRVKEVTVPEGASVEAGRLLMIVE